jgi:hypothetical protein
MTRFSTQPEVDFDLAELKVRSGQCRSPKSRRDAQRIEVASKQKTMVTGIPPATPSWMK